MRDFELVVAGGGLTAARAVAAYRRAGGEGGIALVGSEPVLPYHRPALSKRYLRGETLEAPFVEGEDFYRDNDVEVMLQTRVEAVEPDAHSVAIDGGTQLRYGKLLVATGARPRRLNVPGSDLAGVFDLRTLEDSTAIREAAGSGGKALVVGAGFIGMEAAASLHQLGLAVTLVHLGRGLFDQLGSEELSAELLQLYRSKGIEVVLEDQIVAFGGDGRLEFADTAAGARIEAGLAVVGVGVVPNVELLEGSGIAVDNGVVVDERFAASAPDVYAAGDVAAFFDPLFGRRRRIEHWSNANYQGSEVGTVLAGAAGGYDTVSSFFSEVFGVGIKVFGDTSRSELVSAEGSIGDGLLALWSDGERLTGALAVGQPEEVETRLKVLIGTRAPVEDARRSLTAAG